MAYSQTRSWLEISREKLANPAKPVRAFPYALARFGFVALSCATFFGFNFGGALLIGGALTHDVLSPLHTRWYWAIALAATAFFSGHGGSIGLLDAYAQGRVRVPAGSATAREALNPWRVASNLLLRWGVPAAAISFYVAPLLWPNGVPLQRFAWQIGGASAGLSALLITLRTGAPFLAQTRVPIERRGFDGSAKSYVWQRHALPQAVVNGIINGIVALAIVPGKLTAAGAAVSAAFVRQDMLGGLCVLGLFIAGATHSYARFDRNWCVAPVFYAPLAKPLAQSAAAFALLSVLACALSGIGVRDVSVTTFVLGRMLGCGAVCGWVAYWTARWVLTSR